ncbi:MAG: carbohydrate ABC transporter permease [Christensenellales bacterium]|uniref:Carbohydrate ABC transporter permease n=1 Tax=Candidatus Avichristensenella intestinipullorum TaxID=2840693 RepID=A0A9D0YX85_9FIRM|nr:carbohydrate ABC transporter permease [Christensenellales bacterium]HIQ62535.1 carbohydrate ABC transporter permease [Candidatus Avichristensenella intestinipullorum]
MQAKKRVLNSDTVFNFFVYLGLGLLALIIVYPLYFIVIASVSDPMLVGTGKVLLYPRGITFEGYQKIVEYTDLWVGYGNTILYTVGFTFIGTTVTLLAGYALSRKGLVGRNLFMTLFVITMFFNGGLVPTYFTVRSLGLSNTRWIIMILGSLTAYRVIITRTFFSSSIPDELYEAATLDGCSQTRFFVQIVLPLSKAITAVLVMYTAVQQWNSWYNAMVYLMDEELMPLQSVLRTIILSSQAMSEAMEMSGSDDMSAHLMMVETMKYGVIIVSSVPILCLYPFVQKYFTQGVMIGSIKG